MSMDFEARRCSTFPIEAVDLAPSNEPRIASYARTPGFRPIPRVNRTLFPDSRESGSETGSRESPCLRPLSRPEYPAIELSDVTWSISYDVMLNVLLPILDMSTLHGATIAPGLRADGRLNTVIWLSPLRRWRRTTTSSRVVAIRACRDSYREKTDTINAMTATTDATQVA